MFIGFNGTIYAGGEFDPISVIELCDVCMCYYVLLSIVLWNNLPGAVLDILLLDKGSRLGSINLHWKMD